MDEMIRRRYAIVSDYIHNQTEEAWERLRQRVGQECRRTAAKRPAHFQQYAEMTEVVPGVFVNRGKSVHLVDDSGEVIGWNKDEWADDPLAVTACVNACLLAAVKGVAAVRETLHGSGGQLTALIDETFHKNRRFGS
jgi:hypothetical protein